MTGAAVWPIPGRALITGRMPSLSLRYVCVKTAICRRLLRSLVALARSRTLLKAGTAIAAKMLTVAITTSNSIRVKARLTWGGEHLDMVLWFEAHSIALGHGAKVKKSRKSKIA